MWHIHVFENLGKVASTIEADPNAVEFGASSLNNGKSWMLTMQFSDKRIGLTGMSVEHQPLANISRMRVRRECACPGVRLCQRGTRDRADVY